MAHFDPVTKIFHGKEIPRVYNPRSSLGQVLLFNFLKSPEKIIQVSDDDGSEINCSEMSIMMTNIAQNLHRLGFRYGDTAGLFATNTTFVAPSMFACFLLGLPLSPLDVSFDVDQIVKMYCGTKPKLIFCDHDMTEKLIRALEILESDARLIILTERVDGLLHISDLIREPEEIIRL